MKQIQTIKIPALKGKKIIKDSKLFSWIDPDFVNYGANKLGEKTPAMKLDILEMDKDATFKEMFTEKMTLTQEQILYFVKNHKDKLREDGYATFFLFKSGDNFFVAHVNVRSGVRLRVRVHQFGYSLVWHAEYRRRLVVPKLADTLKLEPLNFKIEIDGVKYKLIKE